MSSERKWIFPQFSSSTQLAWKKKFPMRKIRHRRWPQTKVRSLPAPGQIELPLDYSESERDARPRSRARSKATRQPISPRRLETNQAKRARLCIAPESTSSVMRNINEKLRQGQRLSLTPTLSTIITEANGKRWPRLCLSTSSSRQPQGRSRLASVARMSDEEARDAFKQIRWSATGGEPFCPRCGCVGVHEYKSRPLFKCKACDHQFSVTSGTIFASHKLPLRTMLLAIAIFVNGAKGPCRASTEPRPRCPIQDGLRSLA